MDVADKTVFDFSVRNIDGELESLAEYRGQVLLIVTTASLCGFTRQYEQLEALQQRYSTRGFSVLAFPSDQFGNQEPGNNSDIANFCRTRFSLSLPLFSKIDVNGLYAEPLYEHLKAQAPGVFGSLAIKWNFTKFLVNRDGSVVARYAPVTPPMKLAADIEALL